MFIMWYRDVNKRRQLRGQGSGQGGGVVTGIGDDNRCNMQRGQLLDIADTETRRHRDRLMYVCNELRVGAE